MGLTRKELDKVYEEVKSRYRRKNRDAEIIKGIDILYNALDDYINGDYISSKNQKFADML
jgi:hypothetical protein